MDENMFTDVAPIVLSYYLQLRDLMLDFHRAIFATNKAKISYMRHSLNANSDN